MSRFQKPIYLDYHSTTPVDAGVLEAMLPYFTEYYGNSSSRSHPLGWQASEAVEIARRQVCSLLDVPSEEIFFTSGSTEGLNMAIKGSAEASYSKGKHIISVATEHQAVLDPLMYLSTKGFEITLIPVDHQGMIDAEKLKAAIRPDTILVIAMWANNETGVIHDIPVIGKICNEHRIIFITDATQAVGKLNVNPKESGVDILVLSAHKFYGPKGTGAIWIRSKDKKNQLIPLLHGGGHESGMRAGTLNTPGIVGLGKACELMQTERDTEQVRIGRLRDLFEGRVQNELEGVTINGNITNRLSTVSNLKIDFTDSQAVMTKLRTRVAISSGSACSSANPAPSHVLTAMGLSESEAKSSFRISFGRQTTEEEVIVATTLFIEAINQYRSESPLWLMHKQGIDISQASQQEL
ncbi:MAG: cysteine desulfurase [Bacteroidota bacterium]|nr:cysteine desulfurase [Bacteroidota bacterium]